MYLIDAQAKHRCATNVPSLAKIEFTGPLKRTYFCPIRKV